MIRKSLLSFVLMLFFLSLLASCAPTAVPTQTQPAQAETQVQAAVSTDPVETQAAPESAATASAGSEQLTFNNSTWNYDPENDVYWQIGVQYCTKPETVEYETLGSTSPAPI